MVVEFIELGTILIANSLLLLLAKQQPCEVGTVISVLSWRKLEV